MIIEKIIDLPISGVKKILVSDYKDHRGSFSEVWDGSLNDKLGIDSICQINESTNNPFCLRGLHFQWNPFMGKLLKVVNGAIYDYILDIRKQSPTFGYAFIVRLTDSANEWIWVPPGMAHGVFTLSQARFYYLCSGKYNKNCEAGISPFSPSIKFCDNTDELINEKNTFEQFRDRFILSDKDKNATELHDWINDPKSDNFTHKKCSTTTQSYLPGEADYWGAA